MKKTISDDEKPTTTAQYLFSCICLALFFFCSVHPLTSTNFLSDIGIILSSLVIVGIALNTKFIFQSFFGVDTFKLETQKGKLVVKGENQKGLLDKVGYHNPYQEVSVEKVLDNLSVTVLGIEKEFEQLTEQEKVEARLQPLFFSHLLSQTIDSLKKVPGVNTKQGVTSLTKIKQDAEKAHSKAHAQVEKTKGKLLTLISDRTQAALKGHEKLFPEADKKKINDSAYITKEIKERFAL